MLKTWGPPWTSRFGPLGLECDPMQTLQIHRGDWQSSSSPENRFTNLEPCEYKCGAVAMTSFLFPPVIDALLCRMWGPRSVQAMVQIEQTLLNLTVPNSNVSLHKKLLDDVHSADMQTTHTTHRQTLSKPCTLHKQTVCSQHTQH